MDTWGSSSPSVVVAAEAGDGGGEPIDPSTWIKAAQSTGEAGDAALRFFLALVITGEMTGLLLAGLAWALGRSILHRLRSYSHCWILLNRGGLLLLYQ